MEDAAQEALQRSQEMPSHSCPTYSQAGSEPDARQETAFFGPPAQPGHLGSLEDYQIISLLGRGGMGLVYLAQAAAHPDPVAVKLLRPELGHNVRARAYFLKEAAHLQNLRHPHILPVLEFKELPETAFLVMPYMERGNLSRMIHAGPLLDKIQVLEIMLQVAGALAYAHQHGIIHRDVKPSNILLNQQGQAFLNDFGLARSLFNDELNDVRQNHWEGTPAYLSPQAAGGHQDDTRGDIYSLGAVLYELLTGHAPYEGSQREEIIQRIAAAPPRPILSINPEAPKDLAIIAEKAMARELCDRYAHLSYFIQDLEKARRGEPILTTPPDASVTPSLGDSHDKRKSHRLTWALCAALALLIASLGWIFREPMSRVVPWVGGNKLRLISTIEKTGIWSWQSATICDFLRGGAPELLLPKDNELFVFSNQGDLVAHWKPPERDGEHVNFLFRTNINTDPIIETVVSFTTSSNVVISALNDIITETKRLSIPGSWVTLPTRQFCDSSIMLAAWLDLRGDGHPLLVGKIESGYGLKPRGLVLGDFANQTLTCTHLTGPCLVDMRWADLDGDGKLEIVFGSQATGNGNLAADGTSDQFSYLFVFSSDGKLLWHRQLCDLYSRVHPLIIDVDGKGRKEILAWVEAFYDLRRELKLSETGPICRFNAQGEITARYEAAQTTLVDCVVEDLDGDGQVEVLATDNRGVLHCLDAGLNLKSKKQIVERRFDAVKWQICAVADLNSDQRKEIVLYTFQEQIGHGYNPGTPKEERNVRIYHQTEIIVLNDRLEVVRRHPLVAKTEGFPEVKIVVTDFDEDGQPEIVLLSDKVRVFKW